MNRIRILISGREITDFAPNATVIIGDYTPPPPPTYRYTHKPTGIEGTGTTPEAAMLNLADNLQDAGVDARITTKQEAK